MRIKTLYQAKNFPKISPIFCLRTVYSATFYLVAEDILESIKATCSVRKVWFVKTPWKAELVRYPLVPIPVKVSGS